MRLGNPLRDEAAAFRLVLLTLLALGLIVVASKLSVWLGLTVMVGEIALFAWLAWGAYSRHRERSAAASRDEERAPVPDTSAREDPGSSAGLG
jgi:threonine/homoserine/homoserine lactone efflux protein